MSQNAANPRRRHRKLILVAVFLAAVAAVVAYRVNRRAVRYYYAYASYANALDEYLTEHGAFPDSLTEMERAYNEPSKGNRIGLVPPPPPYDRPSYYPEAKRTDGMRAVIVAPRPSGALDMFTVVVYVSEDMETVTARWVWKWSNDSRGALGK